MWKAAITKFVCDYKAVLSYDPRYDREYTYCKGEISITITDGSTAWAMFDNNEDYNNIFSATVKYLIDHSVDMTKQDYLLEVIKFFEEVKRVAKNMEEE